MPAPLDGAGRPTVQEDYSSASARLLESVYDGLNKAKETVEEHPYLTTAAVAAAAVAAYGLSKGRSGRLAASLFRAEESSAGALSEIIPTATAKSGALAGEVDALVVGGKTLGAGAKGFPIIGEGTKAFSLGEGGVPLMSRPVAFNGLDIRIVSADALKGLEQAPTDLHPNIPKIVVNDPVLRATHLVTQFDGDLAQLYDRARRSAVQLEVMKTGDEGALLKKVGSGFFLTEQGEIVTANHVIRGGDTIQVFTPLYKGHPLTAEVAFVDEANDLALLHLRTSSGRILANIRTFGLRSSEQALVEGEQVVGFGYPNGVKTLHAMPGNFSLIKEVQLGETSAQRGSVLRSFMMSTPGSSGSPLLDRDGKLLSIIVQQNPSEMTSLSVPIGRLIQQLPKVLK